MRRFVTFLNAGCMERNFGRIGLMKDSSSALDSYGSLLSNAPSLAIIRAVLAMIQRERSVSKAKNIRVKPIGKTKDNQRNIKGYQRNTKGKHKENR